MSPQISAGNYPHPCSRYGNPLQIILQRPLQCRSSPQPYQQNRYYPCLHYPEAARNILQLDQCKFPPGRSITNPFPSNQAFHLRHGLPFCRGIRLQLPQLPADNPHRFELFSFLSQSRKSSLLSKFCSFSTPCFTRDFTVETDTPVIVPISWYFNSYR